MPATSDHPFHSLCSCSPSCVRVPFGIANPSQNLDHPLELTPCRHSVFTTNGCPSEAGIFPSGASLVPQPQALRSRFITHGNSPPFCSLPGSGLPWEHQRATRSLLFTAGRSLPAFVFASCAVMVRPPCRYRSCRASSRSFEWVFIVYPRDLV